VKFLPNNWAALRAFYQKHLPAILAEEANEWALDPYAWEEGRMVQFTPIEAWFWADIREADAVLYPQFPVGKVFVDFANPRAKVAIECDGAAYHLDKAKDAARDAVLEGMGWTVYRIPGYDCAKDYDPRSEQLSTPAVFIREIGMRHNIIRATMAETVHYQMQRYHAGGIA
jgi:very-short-patch-repair endonuclease